MELEKFKIGTSFFYDEDKNEGTLNDEDDNEILKFSFDDENSPFWLKLYVGKESFNLDEIKGAKMDKSHKQELVMWYEILQHELDLNDPNQEIEELSNDGLNFM